ncbi:MAG: MCE family protein [Bacteroidetes bacterium]|nr:MCE family protein [Bacteroidota bacterium]
MKLSKEFIIGIVVVVAIATFIWGISFLKGINLFSHKYTLYGVYPSIDNLVPANPVMINGYKIGQVSGLSLINKGGKQQILAKFTLSEDVAIPINSVARAISADLFGTKAVSLIMGNSNNIAKSGDTLLTDSEQGLKESFNKQIAPIQAKAEKLLSSVDSVMTVVNSILNTKTRKNIEESFDGVHKAILSLEKTAFKLDDVISKESAKFSQVMSNLAQITNNLNKNGQRIDNIIKNVGNMSDSLAKSQLRSAIDNADKSMKELNRLLAGINEGQGTLGKLAKNDSLYRNLNKSSEDLDKLLKDLREHPSRYVHFSIFGGKSKKIKN